MAEQEVKKVNIAGKSVDYNELERRAKAKAYAWMDYLGLKGDQRRDFIDAFNRKMTELYEGNDYVPDEAHINYYGKHSGNKKQDGNTKGGILRTERRLEFDPNSSVDTFLNGIAGVSEDLDEKAKREEEARKAKLPQWNSSLLAQAVSDAIFGEGNEFSTDQLMAWADELDPYTEGSPRSTYNRRAFIASVVREYQKGLLNGKYNISDTDRKSELDKVDLILSGVSGWQLNRVAPWISHLLYTDDKYYATNEERDAAKKQALEEALAEAETAYINNGTGTNPYDKSKDPDNYNRVELARGLVLDLQFQNKFDNYNVTSSRLRSPHWLPRWTYFKDGNVFSGYDPKGANGILSLIDAAYKVNTDYSDDGRGLDYLGTVGLDWEWGHDNYTGRGKGDTSLLGVLPQAYFDSDEIRGNDDMPDDVTHSNVRGYNVGRTNNGVKMKFLSDYAHFAVSTNPNLYRLKPGTSMFLLPDLIDWSRGTAYVLNEGVDLKNTIEQINIAPYIKQLKTNNPALYNLLLQSYTKAHKYKWTLDPTAETETPAAAVASLKNGGRILKAQFGAAMEMANSASQADLEALQARIAIEGLTLFNRELAALDTKLSALEYARIGAAAADMASIATSYAPGYGTAAAAGLGLVSTATNLVADLNDKSVSTGDALKGLGINLAMDVASLIPGIGTGAGISKVTKPLLKLAPKILAVMGAINVAPAAIDSFKKLCDGKTLNLEDYKNIAYGLGAVAGIHNMGRTSYLNHKYKNAMPKGVAATKGGGTGEFNVKFKSNGSEQTVKLSNTDIEAINNAGAKGNEAARTKFREILTGKGVDKTIVDLAELVGTNFSGSRVKRVFDKKLSGDEILNADSEGKAPTTKEVQDYYKKLVEENRKLVKSYQTSKRRWKRWIGNNLNTDAEIYVGQQGMFKNPFKGKKSGLEELYAAVNKLIADERRVRVQKEWDERNKRVAEGKKLAEEAGKERGVVWTKESNKKLQDDFAAAPEPWDENAVRDRTVNAQADSNAKQAALDALNANPVQEFTAADEGLMATRKQTLAEAEAKFQPYKDQENAIVEALNRHQSDIDALKNELLAYERESHTPQQITQRKAETDQKIQDLKDAVQRCAKLLNDHQSSVGYKNAERQITKATNELEASTRAKSEWEEFQTKLKDAQDALDASKATETEAINAYNLYLAQKQKVDNINNGTLNPATLTEDELNALAIADKKYSPEARALQAHQELRGKVRDYYKELKNQGRASSENEKAARKTGFAKVDTLVDSNVKRYASWLKDPIKANKTSEFKRFIKDVEANSNGKLTEKKLENILKNEALMQKVRKLYAFKRGGYVPFYSDGDEIKKPKEEETTSTAEPLTTSTADATTTSTANTEVPVVTTETSVSVTPYGTISGSGSTSGGNNENTSGVRTILNYDNDKPGNGKKSSLLGNLTNKSDMAISTLEAWKWHDAKYKNAKIAALGKKIKNLHVTPLQSNWRIFSSKPLLDLAQQARTAGNHVGRMAAAGTSDQAQGFVYQLHGLNNGEQNARPYILQSDATIKENTDKQWLLANQNAASRHDAAEKNAASDVAKYNLDILVDQQLIHDNSTKDQQFLTAVQNGIANSDAYFKAKKRANFLNNDAELVAAYDKMNTLRKRRSAAGNTVGSTWTLEDEDAYIAARDDYSDLLTTKIREYDNLHGSSVGQSFAMPIWSYGSNYGGYNSSSFSFGDTGNTTSRFSWLKKGGKVASDSEDSKNRRHSAKQYFELLKLLLTEANKDLRAMGNGYAYFRKLMMCSK